MWAVFKKAFRDARRMMLWLAIGFGLYTLFIVSFYPAIYKEADKFNELIQSYPKEMISMMYGEADLSTFNIADVGNVVHIYAMTWLVLIMGAVVIAQTFNALTNAERDGTLDVMLSLPVTRREVLVARVLNTMVVVLVPLATTFVTFILGSLIWTEFDVPVGRLALGVFTGFFPLMVTASFTYLLAVALPSSKRFAGGLAYLFFMGSYLVYGMANTSDTLKEIKPLFLFHYYNAADTINNGLDVTKTLVLAAVIVVYLGLAWWQVDRKELGV